jgi:RNA polymerase primary sigma factor
MEGSEKMGSDVVIKLYLQDIGQNPVLSKQEEFDLFTRLHSGDESVREKIIECNLRLVVRLALRYRKRGVALEDLIQEGNIGLLDVIDRFDHTMGYRFSTYAAFWIRQSMQVAIRKQGSLIKMPVRKVRLLGKISEVVQEYKSVKGRTPTLEEVARRLDLTASQVKNLVSLSRTTLSLESPVDEEGPQLKDRIPDKDAVSPAERSMENEMRARIHKILRHLSAREHSVLNLRFGLHGEKPGSLRQVSRKIGLSQEGVRRVEQRALAKLNRTHLKRQLTGLI